MRCADLACPCSEHVTPATHVAVCPVHFAPLVAGEPGTGRCLWRGETGNVTHIGGQRLDTLVECGAWEPGRWAWLPRERFDDRDLPPANGWQAPDMADVFPAAPRLRYRLDVVRRCGSCELELPHAQVGSTFVCLKCGEGRVEQ